MLVHLLTYTPHPLRVMFTAAHTCYSPLQAAEIWQGDHTEERMLRTVRGCIKRNHNTVIRHAVFTFALDGISRACATQLTRHGPGWAFHDADLDGMTDEPAFDQQSQRYVRMDKEPEWVIPDHLSDFAKNTIWGSAHDAYEEYRHAVDTLGVKPEDARALLPACTPTNLVATVNLAALMHFYAVRFKGTTGRPQDEIRELAGRMATLVVAAEPWLGEFLTCE